LEHQIAEISLTDASNKIAFALSSGEPRIGLLASRAMVGAPLKAAAGRATTIRRICSILRWNAD